MRVILDFAPPANELPGVERVYLLQAPRRGQAPLVLGIRRSGAKEIEHHYFSSHWVRPFLVRLIETEGRAAELEAFVRDLESWQANMPNPTSPDNKETSPCPA